MLPVPTFAAMNSATNACLVFSRIKSSLAITVSAFQFFSVSAFCPDPCPGRRFPLLPLDVFPHRGLFRVKSPLQCRRAVRDERPAVIPVAAGQISNFGLHLP